MSKLRQNVPTANPEAPIAGRATGDARPYVIFTQLKERGPHIYAGWLEAVDDEMAMVLAKEHYGRDQECVGIWAIERSHLTSSDGLYGGETSKRQNVETSKSSAATAATAGELRGGSTSGVRYLVFTQKNAGDLFLEAGEVEADSPKVAIDEAIRAKPQAAKAHCVWVAPGSEIISTAPGELIWRTTDQTYRLARGYTREVKEKWQQFRGEEALKEYEREDLKEEF